MDGRYYLRSGRFKVQTVLARFRCKPSLVRSFSTESPDHRLHTHELGPEQTSAVAWYVSLMIWISDAGHLAITETTPGTRFQRLPHIETRGSLLRVCKARRRWGLFCVYGIRFSASRQAIPWTFAERRSLSGFIMLSNETSRACLATS